MTVEHYDSDLFGVKPDIPETLEQARVRAAQGGLDRVTRIDDTTSSINPIQADLGWQEGSGTNFDNLPIAVEGTEAREINETRGLSGRDQERIKTRRGGEPTRYDVEVMKHHLPDVRVLGYPALRATIRDRADGDKARERALLRNHGLEPLDTDS